MSNSLALVSVKTGQRFSRRHTAATKRFVNKYQRRTCLCCVSAFGRAEFDHVSAPFTRSGTYNRPGDSEPANDSRNESNGQRLETTEKNEEATVGGGGGGGPARPFH